ncbi:chymotrypsin-like elastase family member 1 [Chironomus tepperi]|uniref:chymotrypsin-like elastase family member 1 n=1 Tax=Chironomus tepperi TaxID=113505 RepID=UPI00391F3781
MLNLKFFVALALIAVASCENQIPEAYKNAKPISAHPRYQDHQLRKSFPKSLNNNGEITPFIIGGQPADRGQFAHHAMIYIMYPNMNDRIWSGSDSSPSVSRVLKFNSLKAITNEVCNQYFVSGIVVETTLCAETTYNASTCGGDSGGSYIFNIDGFKRLEGVTSFGAATGCQLGYPVGFTRVTSYLDWIYYNINGVYTSTFAPPPENDIWGILRRILERIWEVLKNIFGRP